MEIQTLSADGIVNFEDLANFDRYWLVGDTQ
jgi:hypothetical protein